MSTPARLIAAARRRIRRRNILRTTAIAGWIGVALAVVTLGVSRFWWPSEVVPPWAIALGLAGVSVLVGVIVGRLKPILDERELALLVDRALGTDEVLVTLLHLESEGKAPPAVQEDLERRVAALPAVSRGLAAGPPRHAWMVPLAAVLAALVLLIPQREDAVATPENPDQTEIEEEADRLQDALEEIDEELGEALPEELQDKMDNLLKDLEDDKLTPEEAQERIAELQEELAEWEEDLREGSNEDSDALEEAADALREGDQQEGVEEAMESLADALEEQDTEAAAEAVEELMKELDSASPEQAQKAGEALERAGQALKDAGSQDLQEAGEALEQAGQQMQEGAQQAGQDGKPGENGAQQGSEARKSLEDLAKQLDNKDLKERLQQDQEKLRKSQEVNGALEASRQRLGGEADVAQGEGQGQGEQGQPCTPDQIAAGTCQPGQGQGQCGGGGLEPGTGLDGGMTVGEGNSSSAGKGHTWEDAGTSDTTKGHQDENRQNARNKGEVVDDFEAFYDPVRMDDAEGLITQVGGQIDESGHIDSLPTRRTEGDETAKVKLLDVPDTYVDAADEALANERVPPGYREAVKDYFDTME